MNYCTGFRIKNLRIGRIQKGLKMKRDQYKKYLLKKAEEKREQAKTLEGDYAQGLVKGWADAYRHIAENIDYLLEKGERVIPKKENKPAMMGGSVNITIQAIDTQNAAQVIMQNEPQIIDMIQRAYDSRGKDGGPVR